MKTKTLTPVSSESSRRKALAEAARLQKELDRKKKIARRKNMLVFAAVALVIIGTIAVIWHFGTPAQEQPSKTPATTDAGQKGIKVPEYVSVQILPADCNSREMIKLEAVHDIVIHYVANPGTTAQQNRDFFASPESEVNAHFLIGIDGEVIQCIPLDEKSAASNWRNPDTISIEVCHEKEDGKFSGAAYSSLVKLTAWLLNTYNLDENAVIRHYDITGKACPLYYVEHESAWKKLKKDIAAAL